jgi:hypothetical protein
MMQVYPVSESFDKSSRVVAHFASKKEADALVDRWSQPGSQSSFHADEPITIYKDLKDYDTNNPEALREKALQKLTPEDRKILGLR